jgi:hypothetical protein
MAEIFIRSNALRQVWKGVAKPSLMDGFFAILLLALFSRPVNWYGLLADADTGWHIRTGEWILETRTVPVQDLFSFSRPGQPWFAWEWLTDVIFALSFRWYGLRGVVGLAAAVLCFSAVLLTIWMLRRGAGLWVAAALTLAVVNASSVHYLARPHIFSLLLFTLALWMVDEDQRRPTRCLWLLIPVAALWANLHAGFVAWLGTLGFLLGIRTWECHWGAVRRYGLLAALSVGATVVNPYGWRLHQHILRYLRSSWILDNVQEFQSPSIRSESMLVFAVLLLAGVATASLALRRGGWFEGGLVLVWALAALRSARHIPLFALAAAPVIAAACTARLGAWAARSSPGSVARVSWETGQDLGRSRGLSAWALVFGALALFLTLGRTAITDFPDQRFPVAAISRHADCLAAARVLTSDQWGDYLIYRFYPRQRVFFDGRSDFYGPAIGAHYQTLLTASRGWSEVMARYRFDVALLPLDWPLARVLELDPRWQLVDRDDVAEMLVRRRLKTSDERDDARKVGG